MGQSSPILVSVPKECAELEYGEIKPSSPSHANHDNVIFTLYRDLCRSLDSGFLNKREESAMPEHQGLRIAAKARVSRFPIHCLDLERN